MSAKVVRFLAKTPVYLVLALIGLLWLVPTISLFFTSLLQPSAIGTTGWWEILSSPSLATLDNYRAILDNDAITSAHLDDVVDLARRHVPSDRRRLSRRLCVRLARVPGSRLALRGRRRPARRAHPDGADPDLLALQQPRALRHDPGTRPLPHGLRPAVRDLPAQELLHRDPARPARGGPYRRCVGVPDLLAA